MGRTDRIGTKAADRVVAFVSNLTHAKGSWAGQPFRLREWQEEIVRQLFGTLDADGMRQYRTALLMLPRKNGKTELAAALALYGLLGDGEPGAEVSQRRLTAIKRRVSSKRPPWNRTRVLSSPNYRAY